MKNEYKFLENVLVFIGVSLSNIFLFSIVDDVILLSDFHALFLIAIIVISQVYFSIKFIESFSEEKLV